MATVLDELITVFGFKFDNQELRRFEQRIQQVRQRLNQLSRSFTIAGAVGAAALGFIGKAGLDTEEALLRTRAALDLTEDQMKTLREEALRVGSTLPLNTKDIVNAQLAYGKLGATFEEIIRDAPAIAGAAVATGLQPEQVARYGQIVQNVFGGDINENLDVMLRLANRSAGNFQSFGEALQFSGQSAADAGLDFKAYVALLGGVSGAGRDVEAVSQGLVGMWARLAKSGEGIGRGGKVVTDAFEGVGISMADVEAVMDGTAEGFVNLLALINDANLSTTQLTALLSTVAGDTYSASISFAVQNPEEIRKLLDEALQAPGEVVRQQEIILSGASGGLKQMLAMIDTLLNRLAELGVLTAIEKITGQISRFLGWLTKTDEEGNLVHKRFLQLINVVLGLVALLLPLGIALRAVSFALGGLIPLLRVAGFFTRLFGLNALFAAVANSNFVVSLRMAAINLGGYTARLWAAVVAMKAFSRRAIVAGIAGVATFAAAIWAGAVPALTAFTAGVWASTVALLANPIGLIVIAIVALIAALVAAGFAIYKFRDQILNALKTAWSWIKSNWPLLVGILLGPFGIVGALVWKFRDQIVGALGTAWSWIKDNWPLLLGILLGPFGIAAALIFKFRDDVVGAFVWIKDQVVAAWEAMVQFIQDKFDQVKDLPGQLLGAIPGGGLIKKAGNWFFGQEGGVVPGPTGQPVPAIVHGGEWVLPTDVTRFLEGLGGRTPLPVANVPIGYPNFPLAPGGGRTIVNHTTVNLDNITVHVERGDVDEIATTVGQALRRELQNTVDDFDSTIAR